MAAVGANGRSRLFSNSPKAAFINLRMFNQKEYHKQWRQKNKDKIKIISKRYHNKNREKILAYHKRYYYQNKDKISQYHKQWHQKNKKKRAIQSCLYYKKNKKRITLYYRLYQQKYGKEIYTRRKDILKKYRIKNKEKVKLWLFQWRKKNKKRIKVYDENWRYKNPKKIKLYGQKRYALKKGGGELPLKRIQQVYEDNIKRFGTLTCYLCYVSIKFGEDSLDHKTPLSRGGDNKYENLGVAHFRCNCRKHNKTEKEYRKEMKYYARTRAITSSP